MIKTIKVVKKKSDDENLSFYLKLSQLERLEHLEVLRLRYIEWYKSNDNKQGFQRVYNVVKRA
jgi:hypothetical protein